MDKAARRAKKSMSYRVMAAEGEGEEVVPDNSVDGKSSDWAK